MIDMFTLATFVPAALALNLTPGADMMFCLGQGVRSGPRAALAASAGISVGGMVHMALGGLGLGAAVAAMPWLFEAIRWLGVCYLLYLAWGAFRGGHAPEEIRAARASRAFRDGMLVNLTNPKVILFVLAFVPQFVDPAAGSILIQFLIFGAIMGATGFFVNGGVGVFAGSMGHYLTGNATAGRWLGRISGTIFTGLALRLAIMERA
ncbi:LysE family translocator [Aliisedimentitalea scapharcae]|uniref:LysE family translocator n=1 Tax=Aliisedimentitalea scapharcae TaxID=1524259 RepID=A0ABZ2XW20_9RHOB